MRPATVLTVLVVGGLVLVALALLAGQPRLAFGIAVVDPALPP
jgi:hypothetical protein